jgi:hypothetical protein
VLTLLGVSEVSFSPLLFPPEQPIAWPSFITRKKGALEKICLGRWLTPLHQTLRYITLPICIFSRRKNAYQILGALDSLVRAISILFLSCHISFFSLFIHQCFNSSLYQTITFSPQSYKYQSHQFSLPQLASPFQT